MKSVFRLDASSRCILYSAKLSAESLAKGSGRAFIPSTIGSGKRCGIGAMASSYANCSDYQSQYDWLQRSGFFGVLDGGSLKKMGISYQDKGLTSNKAAEKAVDNLTAPFAWALKKLGFPQKVLKNFGTLGSAIISLGALSGGEVGGLKYGSMTDPLNMPYRTKAPAMTINPNFSIKFSYGSCNLFNANEEVYKPIAKLWSHIAPVAIVQETETIGGKSISLVAAYAGDPFPNEISAQVGAVKAAIGFVHAGVKETTNASKAILAGNSDGSGAAAYFSDFANPGVYPDDDALPTKVEDGIFKDTLQFADSVKVWQPSGSKSTPKDPDNKVKGKEVNGEAMSQEEYDFVTNLVKASRAVQGKWASGNQMVTIPSDVPASERARIEAMNQSWSGLDKWALMGGDSSWANGSKGWYDKDRLKQWDNLGNWIATNGAGMAFKKSGDSYAPTMSYDDFIKAKEDAEKGKKEGGTKLAELGHKLTVAYLAMVQQTKIASVTAGGIIAWYLDFGFKPSTEVDIVQLAETTSLPLVEYGPFVMQKASYEFDLTHLDTDGIPTAGTIKIEQTIPLLGYGASVAFREIETQRIGGQGGNSKDAETEQLNKPEA